MFLLRMIRKRIKGIFAILAAITVALSVSENDGQVEQVTETQGLILSTTKSETTKDSSVSKLQSDAEKATYIILADDMTIINGKGASFSDGVVTVRKSGNYHFKGELQEGRILVNLKEDDDKVVLNFYGVKVTSSKGAPISVLKAPNGAELHFGGRTHSTFIDTAERTLSYNEDEGDSAVIFSKDDIVLTGEGGVSVEANFNKGIFSKKDVTVKEAGISIMSFDDGIRSCESVRVENSELLIVSGGDGIHTDDNSRDKKEKIIVHNSKITAFSDMDGLHCAGDVLICDGEIDMITAGGSTGRSIHKNHDSIFDDNSPDKSKNDIFAGRRATAESSMFERMMGKNVSFSGVVSEGETAFRDTIIKINSAQHGIDSKSIEIENGYCSIKSDGNGLYAEDDVSVDGADVNIMAYCNGMESEKISLVDGKIFINTSGEALVSSKGNEGVRIDGALIETKRLSDETAIFSKP